MQQVKGTVLRSRMAFLDENFGAGSAAKVVASLSVEDQAALRVILPITWYPFDLGERLDAAIVAVLARGNTQFFEKLGAASAERNLMTVHKGFLRYGDPHAFLRNAPAIYRIYYETGRREYESTGARSAVLTTYDAQAYSRPDCLTIVGWHRRALEMCGATGVKMAETECRARGGAVCRYEVSWDEVRETTPARD